MRISTRKRLQHNSDSPQGGKIESGAPQFKVPSNLRYTAPSTAMRSLHPSALVHNLQMRTTGDSQMRLQSGTISAGELNSHRNGACQTSSKVDRLPVFANKGRIHQKPLRQMFVLSGTADSRVHSGEIKLCDVFLVRTHENYSRAAPNRICIGVSCANRILCPRATTWLNTDQAAPYSPIPVAASEDN
jgi:hypothetical protein